MFANNEASYGAGLEELKRLLNQSPRQFGRNTSLWTLKGLAQVSWRSQGITRRQVSDETIRRAVQKLGENWKRAKKWITSPDPRYPQKIGAVTD